jgi:hypothetical protein
LALLPANNNPLDWITQRWVQFTGRKIDLQQDKWLDGPIGNPVEIGMNYFDVLAAELGLEVRRGPAPRGLLARFDDLGGVDFDTANVASSVKHFYEQTSEYDVDAWAEWSGLFKPFGRLLALLFSRRLQQLNVPLSALDTSGGMTSEVLQLVDPANGEVRLTAWVRQLVRTGNVIYAGSYSWRTIPGWSGPCVSVLFPLPNGNAQVIMKPIAHEDGSFSIESVGRIFGDPGFYFTVHGDGVVWARYVRAMQESIRVYDAPNGEVRADHVLKLWGLTFLRLHYRLRLRVFDKGDQ